MHPLEKHTMPNPDGFASDPFGYSALAWQKWIMVQVIAGFDLDPSKPPTSADLKSPVLWLTQAHAMSEAAMAVIKTAPNLESMPQDMRGVCHCQYHAVALMLVGYSLEICLKAMLIIKKGIGTYAAEEKKHHHHRLDTLAEFIPELSEREKAILKVLTHFVTWAGRYPDPGSGREAHSEEIFTLSEQHQIAAKDLFAVATRVMQHAKHVTGSA